MKRILFLAVVIMGLIRTAKAQDIMTPSDPIVRYQSTATYGSANKPDSTVPGLSKWVSVATNGISTGSGSYDASSYKAYFINYYGVRLPFRLKFPKSYGDSAGKKYPIMLFMHGAGEVGCPSNGGIYNNELQLVHGGRTFKDRVDNGQFDGFLMYPQLRASDCWGEWGGGAQANFNAIITVFDSLIKYNRLDIDRVFVDGLSGGGGAVWALAENYPTRIAKAAPTSSAGFPLKWAQFVHIPVWLATGGLDGNPSPTMAGYSVNQFRAVGGDIRQSLYPDLGHSSWDRHWGEADFIPFMNSAHKANPLVFFQRYDFCPDSAISVKIGITPGFYAYEWQKDSVTIATRTGSVNTIINNASIISYAGNDITVKSYGSYRVRFQRFSGGPWSDWSPTPAVIKPKAVTQTPLPAIVGVNSKVLPAPNGKTSVQLQLPAGFQNYQWVRTSDNVQVSSGQVYEAPIGSYKARYSEPYGCGTLYSPIFKVVAAAGTPKPDPAKNVTVGALSQTILRLDWSDNPNAANNETGFEIYRAVKSGGPYTLVKVTAQNAITYNDTALVPNTTYYYVIRAVSETGASANSAEASAKTEVDNTAPTAPGNLEYRGSTQSSIDIRWTAATDNVAIGRYDIYVNGAKTYSTTDLFFSVANLDSLTAYSLTVKAVDRAGNSSASSNQITGYTHRRGSYYNYYEGSWSNLPDFNSQTIVKSGTIDSIGTGQDVRNRDDNFALLYTGRIYIPVAGTYTFETASDDASRLWMDQATYSSTATPLVDNNGAHGVQTRTGSRYLTKGYHAIIVGYANLGGGFDMQMFWSSNVGLVRERIPINMFALDDHEDATALTAPSSLVATAVSYNKINLKWVDNSDNENGFEISRSTTKTGTFVTVKTTGPNATSYSDSALTPGTNFFYKIRAINNGGASAYSFAYTEANWNFNNSYADSSGVAANTLVPNGSISFSTVSPREGSHSVTIANNAGLSFNTGSGGFPSAGPYSQRTIAAWIKPSATNNKRVLFDFGGSTGGMALRFNSNNLIAGVANGSSRPVATLSGFATSPNWIANDWNHVAVVYDQTSLRLYLNGIMVAENTAITFNSIPNSTDASRIGNSTGSNAFNDNTSLSTWTGSLDNVYVINGALSKSDIDTLRNFTFGQSMAKTFDAPVAPVVPDQLTAEVLSVDNVKLTWNDNSTDEVNFEVWRSSGDKTNNRIIARIPGDATSQKSYTDTGLFANVTYYYTVRATGLGAPSAFTSEVTAKTLNTKPVVKKIRNFTMKYGTTFVLPVTATDADGDLVSFSTAGLPAFGTVQPVENNKINLSFSPSVTRIGSYSIKVYVDDANGGRDTTAFTMVVNSNDVPVMAPVANVTINEGSLQTVSLSATDNSNTNNMTWSFDGLPSFVTFANTANGQGTLTIRPGYSASGNYEVTAYIDDGAGAWSGKTFTISVIDKDPLETLQLDFRSASAVVAGWNPINLSPSFSHGTLVDTKNGSTSVSLSVVKGTWMAGTIGGQTYNNTGVYPDPVMKDGMVWGYNQATNAMDTVVLKVSGLDITKTYNFTFFSSYNSGGDATSTTTFFIGNNNAVVNYYQNTSRTDTLLNVVPNAAGEILITMAGDISIHRGGMLNAMVIRADFNDGSVPVKPLSFAATAVPGTGVKLTWSDRSYNEIGYQVYRASAKSGPYTLLNPGATNRDSTSYIDATTIPETVYYYYVTGFNAAGPGISSDTAQISTENNAPVITAPTDIFVKTDATANTDFTVADDAGDAITVALDSKLPFVSLQNNGDNSYRIVTTPNVDNIGWFNLTVRATDNKGAVGTKIIRVSVSDKNTKSVFVKFGRDGKFAAQPWNNWLGVRGNGNVITGLKDETNQTTTVGLQILATWTGLNDLGHLTGNNTGAYPDSVIQTGLYDNTGPKTIKVTGLNPSKKYNLVMMASRNEGLMAAVEYSSGTVKDTLNGRYNTSQTANLNGLTPDASGAITFVAARITGSPNNYLNALVIEEYDPAVVALMNPINLYAEPADRTNIDLSWSDRTNDEDIFEGYVLDRATDSLFTQNTFSIALPANTTTYRNTGLTANVKYWYRIRAKATGGLFSDYSNRAKAITPASIVYVHFNYTTENAPAPWNNTFTAPTAPFTITNLKNQSGAGSGISMSLTRIFNGEFTAGVITGNNSGVVPDRALGSDYWLDKTQVSEFKLSGLNHARRYRIGFFGSSSINGWFTGNYTATYTINGKTVYLNSWMNESGLHQRRGAG
jgi:large repetitive protein